ncbi:hypothetical protein [Eggerthella guodeyinii]|uniref:TetR family transcriptional regulator n=1 Tax=Eggerthella guodeyinii TaxID=2690837 RepID=A0A6N7RM68_9ACTN|nr:hypothetical protein [Eggerthella guodeyinii]MRX82132.1 hypothetical protein [Eggerthella guodeyinii]
MSVKDARKHEFAATFMRLVTDSPPNRRVSVVDITNAMGCERKTFYYYFENVDDLIIWIFRSSFKRTVETEFAGCTLVKPHPELHDPYSDWPFYVRIETEDRFLEQGPYFKTISYHWVDNRDYYANMFRIDKRSYNNLFAYLVQLYVPAVKDDIRYMLGSKVIPPDVLNFLAEYHVMGIFGRLQWHFGHTHQDIMQSALDPYWNYAHTCIKRTIDHLTA